MHQSQSNSSSRCAVCSTATCSAMRPPVAGSAATAAQVVAGRSSSSSDSNLRRQGRLHGTSRRRQADGAHDLHFNNSQRSSRLLLPAHTQQADERTSALKAKSVTHAHSRETRARLSKQQQAAATAARQTGSSSSGDATKRTRRQQKQRETRMLFAQTFLAHCCFGRRRAKQEQKQKQSKLADLLC